ncbi:YnhF family membrane protein [Affinibrenneria salicis]|uniref:YnhF family membrane protein n=1 Tax=Affinibrenneria salicis TaxID=2590031 RepID=A0A5J5G500_9GAMM|nr:YnhF family membrane protein [Affinibrenneria salicis]KAA9002050.1 YnhF family membrane protein [Affinibrenneria salicis]
MSSDFKWSLTATVAALVLIMVFSFVAVLH